MNTSLIEQLLNESESDSLDFKIEQYPFDGADDNAKSELLKDILAFTNSWRRTDAYILIGVREIKGSRSEVVGITKHLEDHSLQQFVNGKTQQPITLSYISITFDGQQIGVIKIPVQSRPVYLKKDYGKLKKNVVYIRRGSSTAEASPDEIAKMGAADTRGFSNVDLNIGFSDLRTRTSLGESITLTSKVLNFHPDRIPDFKGETSTSMFPNIDFSMSKPNKRYYRELVKFFDDKFLLNPVGFAVKNLGQLTVHNVRMLVSIEQESNMLLLTEDGLSGYPTKYINYLASPISMNIPTIGQSNLSLETFNKTQVITVEYGNIQPKAGAWSDEPVFIGSQNNNELKIIAQVYADELPEPASFNLKVGFEIESLTLGLADLEKMLEEEFKRLYDDLDE